MPKTEISLQQLYLMKKYSIPENYKSNLKKILKDRHCNWQCIGNNEYISNFNMGLKMTLERTPGQVPCITVHYKKENWSAEDYQKLKLQIVREQK